ITVTSATIYLAFRYNVWRRFSLQQSSDSKIERVDEMDIKIGDQGKALSVLRPMGTAVFNNKKIEVQSLGEMIEANATIEVIEVLTNKLIVKKI
ncbi:MAG: NfeD family protein, partial [Bacteroidetes bacterium]|nr:NfeD family protein [Bacteroidota bacterium]